MTSGPDFPDEIWLHVMSHVLSDCFSTCRPSLTERSRFLWRTIPRLTVCNHAEGFCIHEHLRIDSKRRIAALSSVNRRTCRALRPLLFSSLAFVAGPVGKTSGINARTSSPTDKPKVIPMRTVLDGDFEAKTLLAADFQRCIDLIAASDGIASQIQVLVFQEPETVLEAYHRRRGSFNPAEIKEPEFIAAHTKFATAVQNLYCSFQILLLKAINIRSLFIVTAHLSQTSLEIIKDRDRLDSVGLVLRPWHGHNSSLSMVYPQKLASLRRVFVVMDAVGMGDYQRVDSAVGSPQLSMTHCQHLRALHLGWGDSAPKIGSEFPVYMGSIQGLRELHLSGNWKPSTEQDFIAKMAHFLSSNPKIEVLHLCNDFGPAGSEYDPGDFWFCRVLEDRRILPNIQVLRGSIRVASMLADRESFTKLETSLWRPYMHRCDLEALVQTEEFTETRPFSMHIELTSKYWHKNSRFSWLKLLPKNLDTLVVSYQTDPKDRLDGVITALSRDAIKVVLEHFRKLRQVEMTLQIQPRQETSTDSYEFVELWAKKPQHPIFDEELESDPHERGHPGLSRIRLFTSGTWVWSDRHGWEYCV